MNLRIVEADLANPRHAAGVVAVLDTYASDPIGDGKPLDAEVRQRLIPGLREQPTALVLLALDADEPVGIAVCFFGFSTFKARPLLNIHDLAVIPSYRGKGVGPRLLQAAEEHARAKGCCKLTLEVQEGNTRARAVYRRFGFADFVVGDRSVTTLFLGKVLA